MTLSLVIRFQHPSRHLLQRENVFESHRVLARKGLSSERKHRKGQSQRRRKYRKRPGARTVRCHTPQKRRKVTKKADSDAEYDREVMRTFLEMCKNENLKPNKRFICYIHYTLARLDSIGPERRRQPQHLRPVRMRRRPP